jgi:hypothetical protein
MNIKVVFLIFLIITGCSQKPQEGGTESSNPKTETPVDNESNIKEFSLVNNIFSLASNENNFKSEKVLDASDSNYTWSLSKNVDFGNISLVKDGKDLIFDYTPNLTINDIEDSFEIKIRYVQDSKIQEKNFLVKIQIGEVSSGGSNGGENGSGGSSGGTTYDLNWKTVINKSNKDSFNEKIVESNYPKILSYELIKDVCSGSSFINQVGNKLYLSYSPSLNGTESIKLKITQETENGDFLIEEKEIFINIGGISAVRDCSSGDNSGSGNNSGGEDGTDNGNNDDVTSSPEESHSWILNHLYFDYNIQQNKFFTSTFQNFFSYEIIQQPCKGSLSISKIDNELFFNYDPEDNVNGTQSFIIKIRQKRSENTDLIVEKEVKINVLQSGEVDYSCYDNNGGDNGSGGDNGGNSGNSGSGSGNTYSNSLIINNPISINSFENQEIILVENDYEISNFNFSILENTCKGEFSLSMSGRNLLLNYDPLDQFFGTQSFKIEYMFYNESNILEKQEMIFYLNIFGESSVDNSCRDGSSTGGDNGSGGGGVIGGDGGSGSDGQAGNQCDPLVVEDCDDGTVDNPVEIVELGYTFTFNESVLIPQNTSYNGTFGIGTPPGDIIRTIVEQPKKGILTFSANLDQYVYIPFINHVGDDSFRIKFEPLYGDNQFSGGEKTFYIKIKASRESLDFNYVGFTSEPDYINVINENDSKTDILLTKPNFLVGFNKTNDHFVSINPNALACPSVNTYYFIKIFGDSEVYNQNLNYGGLWTCEYNVAYLNEEKVMFYTNDYALLGEAGSVYLGILKADTSNNTSNYLNFNYTNFNMKRIFYEKSFNNLITGNNLIEEINTVPYLNLGNGLYSKINQNYYGGYDLVNLYSINNGIVSLNKEKSLIGSFIIINGTYFIFNDEYNYNSENQGKTLLIIENSN